MSTQNNTNGLQSEPDAIIGRATDGGLEYSAEGLKRLLYRIVAQTGGLKIDGKEVVTPQDSKCAAKDIFIPDAALLVHHCQVGVKDPYLSGMVAGEDTTMVDPRQYTVLQANKVEETDLKKLGEQLKYYGGCNPNESSSYLRDLVIFKPDRMALHWVSIMTGLFVKTDTKMPGGTAPADSRHFFEWVDRRDADYVKQVNEIYYKLFGIDRTIDKNLSREPVWGDVHARLTKITSECEKIQFKVHSDIEEQLKNGDRKLVLSVGENEMLHRAIERSYARLEKGESEGQRDVVKAIAVECAEKEIYKARANNAIRKLMESWFEREVFNSDKGRRYQKKQFVPTSERETFVLSGGSATGKSAPMALLCDKLAKGFDTTSDSRWKHEGLDLNNAVHIKSEVLRSLLIEPEFLKYGNRLFYDESAHDERRIIRDEMFKYIRSLLEKNPKDKKTSLMPEGQGPVIIHDRRSTFPHETDILTTDGAKLNYYYFNVPASEALNRNRGRGTVDYEAMLTGNLRPDIAHYCPRFVNARNNIGSQERSARRMLEIPVQFAGKDIMVPLYSTKVERHEQVAHVFGYIDVKNKEIHIRRVPRLIDTVDNAHLAIPDDIHQHPGPIPRPLYKLSKHRRPARDLANAEFAANWIADLVQNQGYSAFISTPSEERRTGRTNTQFAEIYPSEDGKPVIVKTDAKLYDDMQPKPEAGAPSRYKAFLQGLEKRCEMKSSNLTEPELTGQEQQRRITNTLFVPKDSRGPYAEYVANQRTYKPQNERD